MKIGAPAALSRIAARFQERRNRAALGERPPLTTDDEQNIADFSTTAVNLIQLLLEENEALRHADVAKVADLFPQKQELLQRIEIRQPVIEPFLRESAEVTEALRLRIRELAGAIEENSRLLASMAEAAQSLRGELDRVRERHSLKGMYDKSGQTRETGTRRKRGIDANL